MAHCFKWSSLPPLKGSIEIGSGKTWSLRDFQYRHLIPLYMGAVDVFLANKESAYGQEYKLGDTVLWKLEREQPVFVCIQKMVAWNENVWLIVKPWFILGFSETHHCNDCVLQDRTNLCVELDSIMD
jgi:hypothetical protein